MIGDKILKYRAPIGILLLAITAYFGYGISKLAIGTSFVDFFPRNHPYVQLYHTYGRYGEAQTLTLMLQVKHGDIYNRKTLGKIQDLTFDFDLLPAIIHQSVRSLASYRVTYALPLPGNLISQSYMYPKVPETQAGIDELKRQIDIHRREIRYVVSDDGRSAAIVASFTENRLNYHDLFYGVQRLVKKYSDDNTNIYVAGEPMIRGYGYYYLPVIIAIFFISDGIMILALYIFFRNRSTWWAPLVTGTLATVWGLGFIGLQGFEFDPVMLVIRFVLTARDMGHAIQWQGRYYDELEARGYDKNGAIAATTTLMLAPGLLSILADIAGIVFISFGGIPSLQHVASSGAVWLGGSLTMVFIFQPIMMSYLPARQPRTIVHRPGAVPSPWMQPLIDRLVAFPVAPGPVRGWALGAVGLLIATGFIAGVRARIGYSKPGTPLYKQSAKVNRDIDAVRRVFPVDEGWIIIRAHEDPKATSGEVGDILSPEAIRVQRDLVNYLMLDDNVDRVISVVPDIIEPFNRMFHYGEPKYRAIPATTDKAYGLFTLFVMGTAPGEADVWLSLENNDACMRVLLRDHTYETLSRLQHRLDAFVAQRGRSDPAFRRLDVLYLGGIAGLYAAANDVLYEIDFLNITFVLAVVFLFCTITYRSLVAGLLFVTSCIAANFAAFIYMRLMDIGITIYTIPVISLGIGLGVDYGIYTISRVVDECVRGRDLEEAITTALKGTGAAVLATFSVIVGGLAPWMFSPVLFHNQMAVLLIILMFTNLVMGLSILPAYVAWARPRFIFGGVAEELRPKDRIAVD
ncbi:MAG: MMPL family transporter [Candidatus Binataceae bacterium]